MEFHFYEMKLRMKLRLLLTDKEELNGRKPSNMQY